MTKQDRSREEEIKQASEDVLGTVEYQCGFADGAKWADKTMIEKACKWLKDNVNDYLDWYDWEECRVNKDELLYDFRKAMEGGEE